MTQEQINVLARYLGCKFSPMAIAGTDDEFDFNLQSFWEVVKMELKGFKLFLKPISALTQEDFEKLGEYMEWGKGGITLENWLKVIDINDLAWRIADWLRNHGYYLGEECIKEFVKLK